MSSCEREPLYGVHRPAHLTASAMITSTDSPSLSRRRSKVYHGASTEPSASEGRASTAGYRHRPLAPGGGSLAYAICARTHPW